jgi:hypothetical protein
MGLVSWKSFKNDTKQSIYTMDEVFCMDTTKHIHKIMAEVLSMICNCMISRQGDGQMNMDIVACITITRTSSSQ